MDKYILAFPSVTIAIRAQNILRNTGFDTKIIKTPRNLASGCGYSVIISGSIKLASDVLEKNGITPKAIGAV